MSLKHCWMGDDTAEIPLIHTDNQLEGIDGEGGETYHTSPGPMVTNQVPEHILTALPSNQSQLVYISRRDLFFTVSGIRRWS
jgi:hypothetical protein